MRQIDALEIGAGALIIVAVLFGGASRLHELRLMLVELTAVALLPLTVSRYSANRGAVSPFAWLLFAAIVAVPLVQLIPLPASIWTNLPGREDALLALREAGLRPGWAPLSLSPDRTWASALALLPPISMFMAMASLTTRQHRRLIHVTLAVLVASIALGAAQLVSGTDALYPWATTDASNFVGFFANRNHMATFCLIGLPLLAVLVVGRRGSRRAPQSQRQMKYVAALLLIVVVIGVIRSRAGIAIAFPVLGASLYALWRGVEGRKPLALASGAAAAVLIGLGAVSLFALGPILERFETGGAGEGRFENWPTILDGADKFLPVGSGIGTFDPVFRSLEPLERVGPFFLNQAHNDYLETWLETGWLGLGVLVLLLVWLSRRSIKAWTLPPSTAVNLGRAASIGLVAVLLHSAVDYPVRTVTIATLVALLVALLERAGVSPNRA